MDCVQRFIVLVDLEPLAHVWMNLRHMDELGLKCRMRLLEAIILLTALLLSCSSLSLTPTSYLC